MSVRHLEWAKSLKKHGDNIGRAGMSELVLAAVKDFDGSYIGAMILAGRLKAVSAMAKSDGYWSEKVDIGFHKELDLALQAQHAERQAANMKPEGR